MNDLEKQWQELVEKAAQVYVENVFKELNWVPTEGKVIPSLMSFSRGTQFVRANLSKIPEVRELVEALEYYSKPFENEGAYIGNISFSEVHGNDCEVIGGAFRIAGKRARQALEKIK